MRAHRWIQTPKYQLEQKHDRGMFEWEDDRFHDYRTWGYAKAKRDEFTTGIPQGTPNINIAWADLPDEADQIAARAADVVARSVDGELESHEILRADDRGRLARWASPDHQRAVADDLVAELVSTSEVGAHRHEAAVGLASLAERLETEDATGLLARLRDDEEHIAKPSTTESMSSHPNPLFGRVRMRAPASVERVRAAALNAVVTLASAAGDIETRQSVISSGLIDIAGPVRAEAVRLAVDLAQVDLRPFLSDEDALVRGQALTALDSRDELVGDDPALLAAAEPDEPLALRSTAVRIGRLSPSRHPRLLEALKADPHVYIRAVARSAVRDGGDLD